MKGSEFQHKSAASFTLKFFCFLRKLLRMSTCYFRAYYILYLILISLISVEFVIILRLKIQLLKEAD
jgi:hypothetical protein